MEDKYENMIIETAEKVFNSMEPRVSPRQLKQLHDAYEFAYNAHKEQRRKSGEPYIIHPISVALIAAKELMLDTNSVTASFLHDIVEDTPYTIDDIRERFGDDVAFLVDAVTKRKKSKYKFSKQVDNYQQLLSSMQFDIRALMVKIADRLHNMRTLSSMRPDKQMKIAGETDYFYAPLANRLGLFDVKTDLENLSFKYRCGMEYTDIVLKLDKDKKDNSARLKLFTDDIEAILHEAGIDAKATVYWRAPYSLWRRMKAANKDFIHLDNRYYIRVTFSGCNGRELSEKTICLYIYSLLTNKYNEKPGSFQNLIDQGKENSYKSINVMLLSHEGIWEDVQICSDKMVEASRFGCMAEVAERAETRNCGNNVSLQNVRKWIEKFRKILKEIAAESQTQGFIESIKSSLYYDDVLAFTPKGEAIILPKGSTALDFAFELHTDIGLHAKYARINSKLMSVRTVLNRGDVVEIGTEDDALPKAEWMQYVQSYKAKRSLRSYFSEELAKQQYQRCTCCLPLPGGETIGFREEDNSITLHKRNCPEAIRLASKFGDNIIYMEFDESPDRQYPVTIYIKAIDRYHLFIDILSKITNDLHLFIDSLKTETNDDITDLTVTFYVHSVRELNSAIQSLYSIPGVDEVRRVQNL
ncbi:bifunctional (p)ppGpp synthetase/guanosine-3',5'-bis(diphosphate) 3'-pyrophosphohydrolase [Prevotella sp. PINT]|jgi:Guanosine polyphosphate pyrophosphohydrolases/synthetases|uniref:RelA/SpoT family protein n=1 Tax=Palleniella intestinalis TaxID=2736291 RepID=UPI001551D16B|nr:HD domain-containing protein [Palleniella intestinalis]NPD80928.1 bifunctional (p)ppGpp synthetase/guanosine-3',5'-bis(diphosphate) 3'-pyrophosphohydrolase [Palleniella intestinalis]